MSSFGIGAPASFAFISYCHADEIYAQSLAGYLRAHDIPVWEDRKIYTGDLWPQRIREALAKSAALIVLMSKASEESRWVKREILEAEDRGLKIFPLLLNGRRFPELADIQYADVTNGAMPPYDTLRAIDLLVTGRMRPSSLAPPNARERVCVFYHQAAFTKRDALDLLSHLDDMGYAGEIQGHVDPRAPDALFLSSRTSVGLAQYLLAGLPYDIDYLFPFDYPDAECGALSPYVASVGLRSDFRSRIRPRAEEPLQVTRATLQAAFATDEPVALATATLKQLAATTPRGPRR